MEKSGCRYGGLQALLAQHGALQDLAPDDRQHVIDSILRTTIASNARDSDGFYEGAIAPRNDYGDVQAYAAAYVDAFWEDFWADRLGAA